ncbi:MAG: DUF4369 domain-containing protein, partial [Bacteroidetes bacterium]|nr:DUF4369 domain-containing protein [Bacteroidota bacterium]
MKIFKRILLLALLCGWIIPSSAQNGYKLQFHIKGLKDTTCLIANYYGNGTYIKDTLRLDKSGKCTYTAAGNLPKGIYIFIISDKNYFDFIIDKDKEFSMETDKASTLKKMIIKGSPDNTLFYDYLQFNKEEYDKVQAFQKELDKHSKNADSVKLLSDSIAKLNRVI